MMRRIIKRTMIIMISYDKEAAIRMIRRIIKRTMIIMISYD